jgi:purine-binding chemotaxis protein CheW
MNARAPEPLPGRQYLTFSLADSEYAVDLLRVREIVEFVHPLAVPATPASIRGVINLRGTIVPIADLAAKFGFARAPDTKRTCIVMVDVSGWDSMPVGIIADSVNDIVELRAEDIEPPPPFGLSIRLDFLRGVGKAPSKLFLVLELDRVLSPEELSAASDAARQTGKERVE